MKLTLACVCAVGLSSVTFVYGCGKSSSTEETTHEVTGSPLPNDPALREATKLSLQEVIDKPLPDTCTNGKPPVKLETTDVSILYPAKHANDLPKPSAQCLHADTWAELVSVSHLSVLQTEPAISKQTNPFLQEQPNLPDLPDLPDVPNRISSPGGPSFLTETESQTISAEALRDSLRLVAVVLDPAPPSSDDKHRVDLPELRLVLQPIHDEGSPDFNGRKHKENKFLEKQLAVIESMDLSVHLFYKISPEQMASALRVIQNGRGDGADNDFSILGEHPILAQGQLSDGFGADVLNLINSLCDQGQLDRVALSSAGINRAQGGAYGLANNGFGFSLPENVNKEESKCFDEQKASLKPDAPLAQSMHVAWTFELIDRLDNGRFELAATTLPSRELYVGNAVLDAPEGKTVGGIVCPPTKPKDEQLIDPANTALTRATAAVDFARPDVHNAHNTRCSTCHAGPAVLQSTGLLADATKFDDVRFVAPSGRNVSIRGDNATRDLGTVHMFGFFNTHLEASNSLVPLGPHKYLPAIGQATSNSSAVRTDNAEKVACAYTPLAI